jgi:hypothetical protein
VNTFVIDDIEDSQTPRWIWMSGSNDGISPKPKKKAMRFAADSEDDEATSGKANGHSDLRSSELSDSSKDTAVKFFDNRDSSVSDIGGSRSMGLRP